jgi:hypothetical protein
MLNAMKDAVTSQAAQSFVNNQIKRYGTVQDLKINSRTKSVDVSCLLHGEPTPIQVKVESYAIETVGGQKVIQVTGIKCSRPWLQNLLTDYALNRRVPLPPWAAAAL